MMPSPISTPHSLNHVAYPTWDSQETYRFYTEVLGCRFLAAIRLDRVPSSGAETPYLHTFYAMESGECIAFFEVEGLAKPRDDGIPGWIRHIALNVPSMEALHEWRRRLEEHGVQVVGVVDHDGVWESLYFFDPNGVRLELTYQTRELNDGDAQQGLETLRDWTARRQEAASAPR